MAPSSHPRTTLQTAGVARRLFAASLDAVPAVALWGVATLTLASGVAEPLPPSQWTLLDRLVDIFNTRPGLLGWPLAWLMTATVLWHFVTVTAWGTSPGKRIVGLRMVDCHGAQLGPLRALVHAVLRPLTLACLALGPLWALADPERRTLYDRISGVYVAASVEVGNRRSSR